MEAREEGWGGGADPGAEIRGEREIGIVGKEDGGSLPPLMNESGQLGQNPPSEEPRLWSNKRLLSITDGTAQSGRLKGF